MKDFRATVTAFILASSLASSAALTACSDDDPDPVPSDAGADNAAADADAAPDATCAPDPDAKIDSPPAWCPADTPDASVCPDLDAGVAGEPVPSYQQDIAPIFVSRCAECHKPMGPTTITFDTHGQVAGLRRQILEQVTSCRMPPSCTSPLGTDERRKLLHWLVCRAPNN